MCKSPAVAYYTRKIRSTSRQKLYDEIEDAPLRKKDRYFLLDIVEGMTYKELAGKYYKSEAAIYKWKRKVFESMFRYDMQHI